MSNMKMEKLVFSREFGVRARETDPNNSYGCLCLVVAVDNACTYVLTCKHLTALVTYLYTRTHRNRFHRNAKSIVRDSCHTPRNRSMRMSMRHVNRELISTLAISFSAGERMVHSVRVKRSVSQPMDENDEPR